MANNLLFDWLALNQESKSDDYFKVSIATEFKLVKNRSTI